MHKNFVIMQTLENDTRTVFFFFACPMFVVRLYSHICIVRVNTPVFTFHIIFALHLFIHFAYSFIIVGLYGKDVALKQKLMLMFYATTALIIIILKCDKKQSLVQPKKP